MDLAGHLNGLDKAYIMSAAWMNSTNMHKYGAADELSDKNRGIKIMTLYDYYANGMYTAVEEKLPTHTPSEQTMRNYVIEIPDTKGLSGNGKLYCFLDASGKDIKLMYRDPNGELINEVSENILENNALLLEKLQVDPQISPEELAKIVTATTTEDIVNDIDKYGTVGFRSVDDAKNRCDDFDKQRKQHVKKDMMPLRAEKDEEENEKEKEELENEDELSPEAIDKELEQNDKISQDMYGEIRQMCIDNHLNPKNLKQVVNVRDPKTVADKIDNRETNINENAGPVTLYRFQNAGADSLTDKVYMKQGDKQPVHQDKNDMILQDAMEQSGDENVNLVDLNNPMQVDKLKKNIQMLVVNHEEQIKTWDDQVSSGVISDAERDELVKHEDSAFTKNVYAAADAIYPSSDRNVEINKEIKEVTDDALHDHEEDESPEPEPEEDPNEHLPGPRIPGMHH